MNLEHESSNPGLAFLVCSHSCFLFVQVGGSTGEEDEEWEDEGLAEEQEGAEFGWFNDLFVFDTGNQGFSWVTSIGADLFSPDHLSNLVIFPISWLYYIHL